MSGGRSEEGTDATGVAPRAQSNYLNPLTRTTLEIVRITMSGLSAAEKQLEYAMDAVFELVVDMRNSLTPKGNPSFAWWSKWLRTQSKALIHVSPGVGKTHQATRLVNRLYEEAGISSLYLVPDHDFAEQVHDEDTNQYWNHWKGHSRICDEAARFESEHAKKFSPSIECSCDYSKQFHSEIPAVAPINFMFARDLEVLWGQRPEDWSDRNANLVGSFGLRIVDEINFTQAIDGLSASPKQLKSIAETHPEPAVKQACEALLVVLGKTLTIDEPLSGSELYDLMDCDLEALASEIHGVSPMLWPNMWSGIHTGKRLPPNLPPYLLPIIRWELSQYLAGESFNSRVFVIPGPVLELKWRRQCLTPVPTLFLDATADPTLLAKIHYDIEASRQLEVQVSIPSQVTTAQYMDGELSKNSLGLYPFDKGIDARARSS